MDIEKLEKLSCLKLKEEDKIKVKDSLEGVFQMMSALDKLSIINTEEISNESIKTVFRDEDSKEKPEKMKVNSEIDGLHKEDKFFLAPKVIKK